MVRIRCRSVCQGFNPRLPGGRRPRPAASTYTLERFQSTPSGGKATGGTYYADLSDLGFNPRLPGGRRPTSAYRPLGVSTVSIHAFRGEGDFLMWRGLRLSWSFNPRLPGGRRPAFLYVQIDVVEFQSTPSGGKATGEHRAAAVALPVSIHAFRGEGDRQWVREVRNHRCFNPRLPGGRRRGKRCTQRWRS